LWSVMIPTFNCAKYLRETLESVLLQDLGAARMQIEVVDDCSDKDDPEEIVNEVGRGRVLFHRNPINEGQPRNLNICIGRSRGHLIHILHGDDLVEAGFYREFGTAFASSPQCAAIFCRAFTINGNGDLLGLGDFCQSLKEVSDDARELMMNNPLDTPAVVVRRCFYEQFGGFDTCLNYTTDWDMWLRTVVYGRARMLNRPLASYRVSDGNLTSRHRRSAEDLRDRLRFCEKWRPAGLTGFDRSAFNLNLARYGFTEARRFRKLANHSAAQANYEFFYESSTLRQRGVIYAGLFLRKLSFLFLGKYL
jgi:glycosyltransferase involved in cell wall biosynthesis